jgi:hypothetical protein
MFIKTKYSGYNRRGEQCAAGLFLILMEPKHDTEQFPRYTDSCGECGKDKASHETPLPDDVQAVSDKLHRVWAYMFRLRCDEESETLRDAVEIVMDAKHRVDGCRYFRPSGVGYPIKAIVRHTSFSQCGNFMMGFARVHGKRITLSGSYGGDGLTCNVPDDVYGRCGIELPKELVESWNTGGGWNSAGSEAPKMREWAMANLEALRK